MTDLNAMPKKELQKDLEESREDVANCMSALAVGVTLYSGGSVQERLDVNVRIIEIITTELARRKATQH